MEIIYYPLVFIAGLFFGSFLNLVSDRSVRGEPILFGRSHCDLCQTPLGVKDLIPIISYAFSGAKCRYCREKIGAIYPISEILTGLAFVGVAYTTQIFSNGMLHSWLNFVYLIVVASFFITLFLTDIKYRLIPDRIVIPAILFVVIFMTAYFALFSGIEYFNMKNDDFGKYLIEAGYWHMSVFNTIKVLLVNFGSALAIGFFFWFLVYITKGRGMGGGDIRLGVLIGVFNGFPTNVLAIFLGFLFGAFFSTILILLKKKTAKDTIAFGPFLILGSVVAFAFGNAILQWYFGLV